MPFVVGEKLSLVMTKDRWYQYIYFLSDNIDNKKHYIEKIKYDIIKYNMQITKYIDNKIWQYR